MNTITLVVDGHAEPLDQTVHPRRRSRLRAPPPAATLQPGAKPARDERPPSGDAPVALAVQRGELDATIPPRTRAAGGPGRGDLALYLLLFGLVAAAWLISELRLFKFDDDTSYWIGVTGASMVLAQFTYPMRKHLRFMQGLGHVKWWFLFHMGLGIGGSWLILVHSRFRISSLNAGVALCSLCVVVISGVIGRFIYVRIHRGLYGERTSLRELRHRAGLVEDNARSRLRFCPSVEQRLLDFEKHELGAHPRWATHLRQVTVLPLQQWITYLHCVRELRQPLHRLADRYRWSTADLRRRKRRARRLVDQYLHAVVRVAQYSAYERVFALWHVAHLPFVYLLVISAVVHVIAVHAY